MADPAPTPAPSSAPPPELPPLPPSRWQKFKRVVLGGPKDIEDPQLFHTLSLAAFLAWVGLGADGLSSSAYGPDETYRALAGHTDLALLLALATTLTVFVISFAYTRIIEYFPHGGGGYLVATKLLGAPFGLISGSALLVDYALTITTSVAGGIDALWSLVPPHFQGLKLTVEIAVLCGLVALRI